MISERIYSRSADNVTLRYWHYEVDGDKWRGHYGIVGGKDAVSGWSTAKPKNEGRSNATTPEEQALAEAAAEYAKKLKREYRETEAELVDVPDAVMLAHEYDKRKKPLIFNPWAIAEQPKLDGMRFVCNARGGYSREFQPFFTADHIIAALEPVFKDYPNLTLDGELYNHMYHDDFNKISSLLRKKTLTSAERSEVEQVVQYHIYDAPSTLDFVERNAFVRELFDTYAEVFDFAPIVEVPTTFPSTLEELDNAYIAHLAEGYEGQMVRTGDSPYGFGVRSWDLMKRKSHFTEEYPLMRVIEGTGNWAGYAKAVEFMMPGDARAEDGNRPKAGIRGSQEFCRTLLNGPKPYLVTVRHLGLTPGGVPRGPVAVDFHERERVD